MSGGLNRYVDGYVAALDRNGEDVTVVLPGARAKSRRFSAGRRIWWSFLQGLRSSGVDVIDSHFAMYGVPLVVGVGVKRIITLRRSRPVLIVHFHGPWADESAVAYGGERAVGTGIKRRMERSLLRRADQVVVLTNAFAKEALKAGAIERSIQVVSPGVSSDWFQQDATGRVDSGRIRLLCVRRLTPRMGHLRLLQMLEELQFKVSGCDVDLHIVGVGEVQQELQDFLRSKGRLSQVTLHGRLSDDDLIALARRVDAAIVPTMALEGFGLVVLESMAMGLPVISTGQGGLSEAMGPWAHPPFIFSLNDVSSLSDAIRSVTVDAPGDLGAQVAAYAASHTWEQVAERTVALVRRPA